jgi:acyl-CoA thioester hydrolase
MQKSEDFTPPSHAHLVRFTVEPSHIDELGHAGNVTWIRWINDVAIAHSSSVGLDATEYRKLGVVWVVRRHEVDYLWQALQGETLKAATWVADLRGATSLRRTVFTRAGDGRILVRAATTWALIDVATMRPRRIPKELLERYGFARRGTTTAND